MDSISNKKTLLASFPEFLAKDVEFVLTFLDEESDPFLVSSTNCFTVSLNGEKVIIPYRVYLDTPDDDLENILSDRLRKILACIFLRHHDGFVRQRFLKKLIGETDYWIMPFVFSLLGDYVFEIIEIVDKNISNQTLESYKRFINNNPEFYQLTKGRIASYWGEYYRFQFPDFKNYLGSLILSRIETVVLVE